MKSEETKLRHFIIEKIFTAGLTSDQWFNITNTAARLYKENPNLNFKNLFREIADVKEKGGRVPYEYKYLIEMLADVIIIEEMFD